MPLNVPFWKAPTLVTLPTVIVPPADELAELPNSGITGKWELAAVAVAAPTDEPVAELVPDVGAAMLAVVVLLATAVVPLDAAPVLPTPAADCVPTCERLWMATLPTVPPFP